MGTSWTGSYWRYSKSSEREAVPAPARSTAPTKGRRSGDLCYSLDARPLATDIPPSSCQNDLAAKPREIG